MSINPLIAKFSSDYQDEEERKKQQKLLEKNGGLDISLQNPYKDMVMYDNTLYNKSDNINPLIQKFSTKTDTKSFEPIEPYVQPNLREQPSTSFLDNLGNRLMGGMDSIRNLVKTDRPVINSNSYRNGYNSLTNDERLQNNLLESKTKAGSFGQGFANSALLGLPTVLDGDAAKQTNEVAQSENPWSYKIGEFAGSSIPASGILKVASPLTKTIENKLLKSIVQGGLVGGGLAGGEDIIAGKDIKTTLEDTALNGAFGAALGGGLYKVVEAISPYLSKILPKKQTAPVESVNTVETPQINNIVTNTPTIQNPVNPNNLKPGQSVNLSELLNQSNGTTPKISTQIKPVESSFGTPIDNMQLPKEPPINSNLSNPKTSKLFTNTYTNADTNVISDSIKRILDESKYIYEGQHNADQLIRAESKLAADGIENEMNRLRNSSDISGDDTMSHYLITKTLTEEAAKTGDSSKLLDWLESARPKYTQAGQGIQALKQFKKMTPEGAVNMAVNEVGKAQDVIKKSNPKSFNKAMEEIKSLPKDENFAVAKQEILDKYGVPNLSNEETNFIINSMSKAQGMAEGREKDILLGKVRQLIIDKSPSTWVDKIRAARNISLLGNTKTFNRNISGNVLMGVADNGSNTVGATLLRPLDNYMSKITGYKSIALPSLKAQGKGAVEGFNTAISDSLGGLTKADLKGKSLGEKINMIKEGASNPIDTGNLDFNKFETGHKLAFESKPLRILENAVNTSLKVGDKPFSKAYYDDVINQLKKANKTETVTDEMKQVAETVAAQRTYQDTNSISTMMQGLKQLPQKIQNHPQLVNAIQTFVDSLMPYVKTPANILKRGIEYTPAGVIEGLLKLGTNVKKGTLNLAEQRKIIDVISRGIVGTGIIGGGIAAGKAGLANGAASSDKEVAALEKNAGKLPNSIKVGDKYYDFSFAQPISTPFGAGVQAVKGKNGFTTSLQEGASNALNFYADMPMLQGLQRLMGSGMNDKPIGDRLLEAGLNLPTQFVPTSLKQVTQMIDDNARNTSDPDKLKNTLNLIQSRIPGASEKLPPKIDTLGREVLNYQGNNNLFNVALNPGNNVTYNPTPGEKLVLDLYDKTGLKTQFPRIAPNKDVNGKPLDINLQTELQKEMGKQTLNLLNGLAKTTDIENMNEKQLEDLAKRIESALTKIQDNAKHKVLPVELRVKERKR